MGVIVGDRGMLSLPFRRHAVPAGKAPRGPFSSSNVMLRRRIGTSKGSPSCLGSASSAAVVRNPENSAAETLGQAVSAYRIASLSGPRTPGEPTPREFLTVALVVGAVVSLQLWLAMRSNS